MASPAKFDNASIAPTLQLYAVEIISKNCTRQRRKDQIQLDITFLKQVNYPNIVSLYDVYEDESEVHIVTELWRGGELHDKIDKHDQQLRVVSLCYREEDAARISHSLLSANILPSLQGHRPYP